MQFLSLSRIAVFACIVFPVAAIATTNPVAKVSYSFENALTLDLVRSESEATIPPDSFAPTYTDPKILKTIEVVRLANIITDSLDQYEKARCVANGPLYCGPILENTAQAGREVCEGRLFVADHLAREISSYSATIGPDTKGDKEVQEALTLSQTLIDNMKAHAKVERPYCDFEGGIADEAAAFPSASPSPGGGLAVTTGGAQNYDYFKKIVEGGDVPKNLVVEGFLHAFDLSLEGEPCDQLICVFPDVGRYGNKMFVQIGLATGETAQNFQRKPLNLSLVLDISGSMSATDNTHQNRLEWAKEALAASVSQLNETDILSIVLFDTESQVLLPATHVKDKAAIFNLISGIQTQGSTNLEAGLRDGYNQVSANLSTEFENRVILISDAGLNTGVTNTSELIRLVSDNAAARIGLTAIGMGDNFNEEFIHAISRSRGGNYLFVQSGDGLANYFDQFRYLVTPVAYGFKADLNIEGIEATLHKVYGIPQSLQSPVTQIFDVQTLFLTSGGGGAILLEYNISDSGNR